MFLHKGNVSSPTKTKGVATSAPGRGASDGRLRALWWSVWPKADEESVPPSLFLPCAPTSIILNGEWAFVIVELGTTICWGLDGDMFPINCSNTIWKFPQFLEVLCNDPPFLCSRKWHVFSNQTWPECLTYLFHNAHHSWESNPVAERNCFVWISSGQKSVM